MADVSNQTLPDAMGTSRVVAILPNRGGSVTVFPRPDDRGDDAILVPRRIHGGDLRAGDTEPGRLRKTVVQQQRLRDRRSILVRVVGPCGPAALGAVAASQTSVPHRPLPRVRLRPAGVAGAVPGVRGGTEGGSHVRRLLRWAWNGATWLSLLLFGVACAGWARGYRAVDELHASLLGCSAQVVTYNGRLRMLVRVPTGGPSATAPDSQAGGERGLMPFMSPQQDAYPLGPLGPMYLWRLRWPLATTNFGRDVPMTLFWAPAARTWTSRGSSAGVPNWSDRCLAVRVPHRLAAASFALLPGWSALGWHRRRRKHRVGPAFEVIRLAGAGPDATGELSPVALSPGRVARRVRSPRARRQPPLDRLWQGWRGPPIPRPGRLGRVRGEVPAAGTGPPWGRGRSARPGHPRTATAYARIARTTLPWTSVSRKSRPAYR